MKPTVKTEAQRKAAAARLARLEERLGELMTLRADLEEAIGAYDSDRSTPGVVSNQESQCQIAPAQPA